MLFCKSALRMESTCGLSCDNIGHAYNTIQALIADGTCRNDDLSHCGTYIVGMRFVIPMNALGLKIETFASHGRLSSTPCVSHFATGTPALPRFAPRSVTIFSAKHFSAKIFSSKKKSPQFFFQKFLRPSRRGGGPAAAGPWPPPRRRRPQKFSKKFSDVGRAFA